MNNNKFNPLYPLNSIVKTLSRGSTGIVGSENMRRKRKPEEQ